MNSKTIVLRLLEDHPATYSVTSHGELAAQLVEAIHRLYPMFPDSSI